MIKIAHLYYDLLNLYGESGNIKALIKAFKLQDIDTEIDLVTIGDKIDFTKYDIIYIGTGTEENILLALDDIKKYNKKDFSKSLIIATGNSNVIFGKSYTTLDNKSYDALNLFDYNSVETPFRTVGENYYYCSLIKKPIIGFLNHQITFNDYNSNLFTVKDGNGYKPKCNLEGLITDHYIGTLLLGPLLIRNPYFTYYIVKLILTNKELKYNEVLESSDITAYNNYLKNFINN